MKDDATHLLNDIKNALLGIAIMLAGLGFMGFSITTHGDTSFSLAIILEIIGFMKVVNAWMGHESADAPASESAQPEKIPDPAPPSDESKTPKED